MLKGNVAFFLNTTLMLPSASAFIMGPTMLMSADSLGLRVVKFASVYSR
ncbi:MAG: hypothetical protein H7320_19685 [Ferruginibacter sp.]|nr:hypothetical protein [Ferruginibacter sp.]